MENQVELNGYILATNSGMIKQPTHLFSGYYMTTPSEKLYLVMQKDGNLVIYSDSKFQCVVWAAECNQEQQVDRFALQVSGDSQLEVYKASTPGQDVIWSSNNKRQVGMKNGVFVLDDDGSLRLSDLDRKVVVWNSSEQNKPRKIGNVLNADRPNDYPYDTLYDQQYLEHGEFQLHMQGDGNLVLYKGGNTDIQNAIWSSNTINKGEGPHRAYLGKNGNFAIIDKNDNVTWSTSTINQGNGHYNIDLQEDGNLVLYDSDRKIIWKSDTKQA